MKLEEMTIEDLAKHLAERQKILKQTAETLANKMIDAMYDLDIRKVHVEGVGEIELVERHSPRWGNFARYLDTPWGFIGGDVGDREYYFAGDFTCWMPATNPGVAREFGKNATRIIEALKKAMWKRKEAVEKAIDDTSKAISEI